MITKLELENFMRLRSVDWAPDAGRNVIGGKNGNGKTSLIRGIDALFGGAEAAPPVPIRLGEEHAKVVGETPDFVATRRWWRTAEGVKTELKVVSKVDGLPVKKPQTLFDRLFPPEADPTMFFKLQPTQRVDWVLKVIGVDPTAIDRQVKQVYDARTLVNRDLDAASARLKAMPTEKPPPSVDVAALQRQQGEAQALKDAALKTQRARDAAMQRTADAERAVRDAEEAVKQAQKRVAEAQARVDELRKAAVDLDNAVDDADLAAEGCDERIAALSTQMRDASVNAAANARWAEREKLFAEVQRLADDSKAKTEQIEKLRADKTKMLAGVKFPIEGLGLGDGDVTFKDLPLEQASGAEKIRIGAALLVARQPDMKLFRVTEGSNLDEDNLAALDAFGQEHGIQTFLEVVGEHGPATIIIRDGSIVDVASETA